MALAYSAIVVALLVVALAGPAAGRPVDLVLGPTADAPRLPASSVADLAAPVTVLQVRVPPTTAIRPDPPGLATHRVAPSETLFGIAALYGISPQTLAFNNRLRDTAELVPGRLLLITPPDVALYDVVEGDTVSAIAKRFGADPDTIRILNRIEFEPTDLIVGLRLIIPIADTRFPGFKLKVSEAPRLIAYRLRLPVRGFVTQRFHGGHSGVDIAALQGSPISAPDDGTVTATGWDGIGGLHVCVRHDWGLESCLFHASAIEVELGERVLADQMIARVGSTGHSSGPHVHWETRTNGALVDPLTWTGPELTARAETAARTLTVSESDPGTPRARSDARR